MFGARLTSQFMLWKNVITLGICFMLVFTSYLSLQNLQSSIHQTAGLGMASLAVIYGTFVLSSLIAASPMQRALGYKWTIVVSMGGYSAYVLANFWPLWWTIMPASFIIGVAAGPLWAATTSYLAALAEKQVAVNKGCVDALNTEFLGVLLLFFQSGHIWGNLLSSSVLQSTGTSLGAIQQLCGVGYCSGVSTRNKSSDASNVIPEKVASETVSILLGTFLGATVLAIFIAAFFLDDISAPRTSSHTTIMASLCETLGMLTQVRLLSLLPLTLAMGLAEGLVVGSFTEAFVSCRFGIPAIGYVMIGYGVSGCLASLTAGYLRRRCTRPILSAFILPLQVLVVVLLLSWEHVSSSYGMMISVAVIWAIPRYAHKPILLGLYVALFPSKLEAGFANYYAWEAIGFTLAFVLGLLLCFKTCLYILLVIFIFGMICYFAMEVHASRVYESRTIDTDEALESMPMAVVDG